MSADTMSRSASRPTLTGTSTRVTSQVSRRTSAVLLSTEFGITSTLPELSVTMVDRQVMSVTFPVTEPAVIQSPG